MIVITVEMVLMMVMMAVMMICWDVAAAGSGGDA